MNCLLFSYLLSDVKYNLIGCWLEFSSNRYNLLVILINNLDKYKLIVILVNYVAIKHYPPLVTY